MEEQAKGPYEEQRLSGPEVLASFDPAVGDYILRGAVKVFGHRPMLIAFAYLVVSLGGIVLLSFMQNVALPSENGVVELFEDYGNLINFGIIVPMGILLVFNFYRQLKIGFAQIIEDGVLSFPDEVSKEVFFEDIQRRLNKKWFFFLALLLAAGLNVWIALNLSGYWNSLEYGLPGIWFRICATLNFYMVFYILIKGVATSRMIRLIFEEKVELQPLHPDRCSGLHPLGSVSGAINLFLSLLTLYLTVLVFIDGIPLSDIRFLVVLGIFGSLATYLFFAPLIGANRRMRAQKRLVQTALNREFQKSYNIVAHALTTGEPAPQEALTRLESLEKLYQISVRTPTWPVQMDALIKFFAVVGIPAIMGFAKTFILPSIIFPW